MPTVNDYNSANLIIAQNFATMRAAIADAEVQAKLDQIVSEVVLPAKISHFLELAYANAAALSAAQKADAADVGHFAWINGFYGLANNQRGQLMEAVLRGETLPTGAVAPVPDARFVPPDAA